MIFSRAETMSADERAALQDERLRGMIDRLLAADGIQASRLRSVGVSAGSEISLSDLSRLPTTIKTDLWDAYPFGMLSVPVADTVCVHGSSGTSGRPTLVAYTEADMGIWGEVMARCLAGAGATPSSIVHNAYGYGLFTGGLGVHHGARALGATVVPISSGMTDRQVRLIQDLKPDVLTCSPSYAAYLGEAFAEAGIKPADISLKVGIHGAESWTTERRDKIQELLGIRALDIYGLSEIIGPGVAFETLDSDGWLHVQDDHFIVEALDPETGQPVPDGEVGELTFTTVTKEALPLLRYRTGDLARLDRTPSADGRTSVKMSKVIARKDDMLVVRGVNVYPSEIEAVVLGDAEVGPEYVVVVDERADMARLVVCCEPPVGATAAAGVPERLGAALHARLGISCTVRLFDGGSLPRNPMAKARRVVRWAGGEPPVPGLA